MQPRQHSAVQGRRPQRSVSWLGCRWQALCVLAACCLTACSAQVYQNPFNVTNTGPIGANSGGLLGRLSNYVPASTPFPNTTVSLGSTTYRVVGQATLLYSDGNATDANLFQLALYQSFREQYQFFNLLNQFNPPTLAGSAPTTPAIDGNATDNIAAGPPYLFNQFNQYASLDITVGVFAGTDLAAKLTNGWLPVGKYVPLSEASMRQQGYEVQILPLTSTASLAGAQLIYPRLPTPNTTAFELIVNITGPVVVPFNLEKQTALLSVMARNFPRLSLGFGPVQTQVVSVVDDAAAQTAQVTLVTVSNGAVQAFAERLTQSLSFSLASLYVAGLQYTNYTVQSLTTVSGYTLPDQVNKINNKTLTALTPINQTALVKFQSPALLNVSSVPAGAAINSSAPMELGAVWYRLVGANLTGSSVQQDVEAAVQMITARLNLDISFGPFVQTALPNTSVSTAVGRRRTLLQATNLTAADTEFNNHNSYAAVDFNVTYLANSTTRLPVTWLPLSQYARYFEEVMRFRGYQVHWLTLGANLLNSSAQLFLQLPQIDTVSYQTNITLAGSGLATSPAPFTVAEQTAVLTLVQNLLPSLFLGLGPQWARIQSFQSNVTSNTTEFSLLFDSILPPIWNDTDDTFPQLFNDSFNLFLLELSAAGLDSTVTLTSIAPVNGHTLEAQMRSLNGLPVINVAPLPAASGGGGGLSGGAIAGIIVGALAVLAILLAILGVFMLRKRRRRAALQAERDAPPGMKRAGSTMPFMLNGTGGTVGSQGSLGSGPDGRRGKDYFGNMDVAIKGWDIDIAEIEFARRPDGSEWLLGEGSYGKVYRAVRGGVQDVAVKVLNHTENDPRQIAAFEKEISILKSISYDRNIVQFYGAVLSGSEPMLVLEYMEGGDLRAALSNDLSGDLRWYNRGQHIALDVARGLHYLHSHDVMHSDIKARNVLLSANRDVAKISDVGVAKFLNEMATQTQSAYVAWTFAYAAPEILMNQKSGAQADVYSFGVMLWEMVTGLVPTRGGLTDVTVPDECPAEIADLIQACLQLDQTARPTAKECFAIIKRSLREGSDEPHSVGSGVPSVVVPSFISTAYTGTDTSRGGSEAGDVQPLALREPIAKEGAEAEPRGASPNLAAHRIEEV